MDARYLRLLATIILYGSLVLAFCVPATHPELPLRYWSATWGGLWLLFMGLLVVCDRSLFHYSFRMIGCIVTARLGCSVLLAAFVATRYHKLPFIHDFTHGVTHRAQALPALAPAAAAVVVVSYFWFLRLRRKEQFFTAQR